MKSTTEVKSGSATIDPEDTRDPSELDAEELYSRLTTWFKDDLEHAQEWREEAREAFAFRAGDQYTTEEKQFLKAKDRPAIVFNRCGVIVDAVIGAEVNNRQEVRYLPRTIEDTGPTDVLTSAARYFRQEAHAEDEESDAWEDAVTAGMGWTETRLDFEDDPDGSYDQRRVSPFEMVWDQAARQSNLIDARRIYRVKEIPLKEAMDQFPDADPHDLDAGWAGKKDTEHSRKTRVSYQGTDGKEWDIELPEHVTIVHAQWTEMEDVYRLKDPVSGQSIDLLPEEYKAREKDLKAFGVQAKKAKRKTVKQAFLGGKILEVEGELTRKTLCGKFTWKCITGKRDENARQWYGIVRPMMDPQRWANKWLSQTMHILNSQAKGGVMAEENAFTDKEQARQSWAKSDDITWVANGALQNGRIEPKPMAQFPQGHQALTEFAVSSIRDVSGVNLELLGAADRDQPGILEFQRSKQAMATLAKLFASLRRYRKLNGELMLGIITEYLSDGRLVRIVGEEGEQYVPLTKQPDTLKYDVIVDDAPTAPNQKEITWNVIQTLPPQIMAQLPPQGWGVILDYAPTPASFNSKMKQIIDDVAKNPPPNPEMLKMQAEQQKMQMQAQLKQQEAQQQAALESQKAERQAQIEGAQAASDIETQRQKAAMEMELASRKAEMEMAMKEREHQFKLAELQASLQAKHAEHQMAMTQGEQAMNLKREEHGAKMEGEQFKALAAEGKAGGGLFSSMEKLIEKMTDNHKASNDRLEKLMKLMTADTELVRDPKTGRATGVRKVLRH